MSWKEIDPLLGTEPDSKIARRFGLNPDDVSARRKELGIPGFRWPKGSVPSRASHIWTAEEDALLGTDTIAAVAKKLGVPTSQVQKRMKKLDIPAYMPVEKRRSPARRDQEAAAAARRRERSTRFLSAIESLKKGETLENVAIKAGVTVATIKQWTAKAEELLDETIPIPSPASKPKLAAPAWTSEMDAMLGTKSDAALASLWNCSTHHVRNRRIKLRIASFGGGGCDPYP